MRIRSHHEIALRVAFAISFLDLCNRYESLLVNVQF